MSNFYSVNQFNNNINLQNRNEQISGGSFNGRLFFKPGEQFQEYTLFDEQNSNVTTPSSNEDLVSNTISSNPLSQQFLSSANISIIQQGIINKVKEISNGMYNIGLQNELQLLIIMRSMYLQYGKNQLVNVDVQINELNNLVIDECIRIIIPNIQQHKGFIDDISSGIKIMPYAQNVSGRTTQLAGFDSVIPSPQSNLNNSNCYN